jgi:hypothetical protein
MFDCQWISGGRIKRDDRVKMLSTRGSRHSRDAILSFAAPRQIRVTALFANMDYALSRAHRFLLKHSRRIELACVSTR